MRNIIINISDYISDISLLPIEVAQIDFETLGYWPDDEGAA